MRFIDRALAGSSSLVVFGASVLGKIVLDALEILGVKPSCFCDNDVQKQRELFYGYEVVPFSKLCSDYRGALVIIAAGRYFQEIKEQLLEAGFDEIYSDLDVINCIDFQNTPRLKLEKIVWHLAKIGKLQEVGPVAAGGLYIPRLNVVITTRCTLRCAHCSSLMPYYENPSDFCGSEVISALSRIFAAVDLIYHVELLGGEPFLNSDFTAIARYLLDSGKVLHVDVVTNGTVLPPDAMLESLRHPTLSVVINDYGDRSRKLKALCETFKGRGIDYRINRHWAWADLGSFQSRNLSEKQMAQLFAECNFNSCTELLDGRLYRCPRSSHGTKTGLIPKYQEDFVEILDCPLSDLALKEKMRAFFQEKSFVWACNHCNGNRRESLNLAPAEQSRHGAYHERK